MIAAGDSINHTSTDQLWISSRQGCQKIHANKSLQETPALQGATTENMLPVKKFDHRKLCAGTHPPESWPPESWVSPRDRKSAHTAATTTSAPTAPPSIP